MLLNKVLSVAGFFAFAAFVCLFIYLALGYPDAPLRPCDLAFCGKQGQPHTEAEYDEFSTIEYTLPILFISGSALFALANRKSILKPDRGRG